VLLELLLAASTVLPQSGTVRTDALWSAALGVTKHYLVYLPPSYATNTSRRYPVAYYLHGYGGDETNWVQLGHLDAAMDSLIAAGGPEMIVVMPDGDNSWYTTWNSMGDYTACKRDTTRKEPASQFCVPWPHYDDYVARDLVHHVDSVYRTTPDRAHRAIAGLSMGGYGAVELALQYPDVWRAAASHSGTLQLMYAGPHPYAGQDVYATDIDQLEKSSGPVWPSLHEALGNDTTAWRSRDPLTRVERLKATRPAMMPALYFDVGQDDPFVDQNRAFDAGLSALRVPHEYHEYPGTHNWEYWSRHVGQSLAWIGAQFKDGQ
jgi:S-formylglutathione hydrolase FrmB